MGELKSSAISKHSLRSESLACRASWLEALGPVQREEFDQKLVVHVGALVAELGGARWGAYRARHDEAPCGSELLFTANSGVQWAFPRVHDHDLEFWQPQSTESYFEAHFEKGTFGISEPRTDSCERVSVEDLNGILVPCVAMDRQGHRLGWGRGFYDRVLSQFKGHRVAVAYSVQVLEHSFPSSVLERWDQPVDFIATEEQVIRCGA